MNLSLIEKLCTIFKYIFSSFLSIEMFILSLLLFLILIFNLKRKNQIVQMIAIGVYIGFVVGILISYTTYVTTSVDSFIKETSAPRPSSCSPAARPASPRASCSQT